MAARPPVTVVIPFLNTARFLRESIESVLSQRYDRWELMLVDDGSVDGSDRIAREYERRFPGRIRYLEHAGHANRGTSASRNLGMMEGTGPVVAFLDSDDVWLPEKLEEQIGLLNRYTEVGFLSGREVEWFSWTGDVEDGDRDFLLDPGLELDRVLPPTRLLELMIPRVAKTPPQSCSIVYREVAEAVGGFEDQFRTLYDDQAFIAKVNLVASTYMADRVWHLYRRHPNSTYTIARAKGDRSPFRIQYLEWLIGYLRDQRPEPTHLLELARKELRELVKPPARVAYERVASVGRRLAKTVIPRPLHPRIAAALQRRGRGDDASAV